MTWPTDDIDTTSLDSDTERPDRGAFRTLFTRVKEMIAARGRAGGVASLDDDGHLPAAQLDTASAEEARTGRSNEKLITPATLAEAVPTGAMMWWPTETPPNGWRECDGSAISRTGNPRLFAVIGTRYGEGDGRTTFNVPDGRGEFVRGWNHGRGADPDASDRTDRGDGTTGDRVGTRQADQLKRIDIRAHRTGLGNGGFVADYLNPENNISPRDRTIEITGNNGSETRGRNIALMLIIKT